MKKWLILALFIVSTGLVAILYISQENQKIIKQIPLTEETDLDSIVSDSFSLDPEEIKTLEKNGFALRKKPSKLDGGKLRIVSFLLSPRPNDDGKRMDKVPTVENRSN